MLHENKLIIGSLKVKVVLTSDYIESYFSKRFQICNFQILARVLTKVLLVKNSRRYLRKKYLHVEYLSKLIWVNV